MYGQIKIFITKYVIDKHRCVYFLRQRGLKGWFGFGITKPWLSYLKIKWSRYRLVKVKSIS